MWGQQAELAPFGPDEPEKNRDDQGAVGIGFGAPDRDHGADGVREKQTDSDNRQAGDQPSSLPCGRKGRIGLFRLCW